MITLIHGDNTLNARNSFRRIISEYKNRGVEIVRIDNSKEIEPQLTNNSLFSSEILFIVENPKKFPKLKEEKTKNLDLIILCDQEVSATFIKSLPKSTKIEKFDIPKLLFKFLDNIKPGNANFCLESLHNLLKSEPIELVFTMIGRQIRDLYWVKADEKSLNYPSWRVSNMKRQVENFTIEKLKIMISSIAEIDVKAKTGEADLSTSLDLLIVKALK